MPTYDYECPQGHRFELFQKMTDEPGAPCPECGADARRQISGGAGFLFKGEGFYITDYRSDEYKKKASADKGESTGESSTGGSSKKDDGGSGGSSNGTSSSEGSSGSGSSSSSTSD
jgi:putative FmdB family regulatory protein